MVQPVVGGVSVEAAWGRRAQRALRPGIPGSEAVAALPRGGLLEKRAVIRLSGQHVFRAAFSPSGMLWTVVSNFIQPGWAAGSPGSPRCPRLCR